MDDYLSAINLLDTSLFVSMLVSFALLALAHIFSKRLKKFSFNGLSLQFNRHYWLIVFGVGLGLRLPRMFEPLWYDETFTARMATIPLQSFPSALLADVHPPFHYLIVRVFVGILGDSEFVLRLPSLIAGLGLIWLIYRLAWRMSASKEVAQTAGLLIAVLPAAIHYSAEARYPIFLAFAVLFAVLSLEEKRFLFFALGTIASVYLHAIGLFYALILISVAFIKIPSWRRRVFPLALLCGSWLPFMLMQSKDVINGFWLPNRLPIWHVIDMSIIEAKTAWAISLIAPILLLISWQSIKAAFKLRGILVFLAIVALVPALVWIVSTLWHPIYLTRALMASTFLMLVAWAWVLVNNKQAGIYQLGTLAVVIPTLINSYIPELNSVKDIFSNCQGSDITYTTTTANSIEASYYAPSPAILAWAGGDNHHQELGEAKELFYPVGDISAASGEICLVGSINYYTSDSELEHLKALVNEHNPQISQITNDRFVRYFVMKWRQ